MYYYLARFPTAHPVGVSVDVDIMIANKCVITHGSDVSTRHLRRNNIATVTAASIGRIIKGVLREFVMLYGPESIVPCRMEPLATYGGRH